MKSYSQFMAEQRQLEEDFGPFGVARFLSPYVNKGGYAKALEILMRMHQEEPTKSILYLAGKVARMVKGVDARKLADMIPQGA